MNTTQIYEAVTVRVMDALKKGEVPWCKPWIGRSGAISRQTGKPYKGWTNQLLLDGEGEWATSATIHKEGGRILKGHHGRVVVFWKMNTFEEENEEGEKVKKTVPLLRYSYVFNVEKDTTLEPKYLDKYPDKVEKKADLELIKQGYLDKYGVGFSEVAGDEAFYSPSQDSITVPLRKQFKKVAEYYSTVFHEIGHSTGHKNRLNRLKSTAHFGNEEYSREELVAELTSCGILNATGHETESSFRNSTAYIQSWLKALKNDSHMIVWACGRAEKAFNMIMDAQAEPKKKTTKKKATKKTTKKTTKKASK